MKSPFFPARLAPPRAKICAVKTEIQDTLELHDGDLIVVERTARGLYVIGVLMLRDGEMTWNPIALRPTIWRALWLQSQMRAAIRVGASHFDARKRGAR